MRVKDWMVKQPVAATVPGHARDLLALFVRHGLAGFPVTKEGTRKLAGTVTRHDLLCHPDESQVALLMNPNPATTYAEAPIPEAAHLVASRGLRLLPVVNGSNDLVGLLTPGELLPGLRTHRGLVGGRLGRRFVPVHEATPLPVALEVIRSTHVGALPVLDDQARLSGILTEGDVLRHAEWGDERHESGARRPVDADARDREDVGTSLPFAAPVFVLRLPAKPLRDVMTRDVVTTTPTTSVRDAAALMARRHLNQLPVVAEDGRLLDLVTDVDLVGALA